MRSTTKLVRRAEGPVRCSTAMPRCLSKAAGASVRVARVVEDVRLAACLCAIHRELAGTFRVPWITVELREVGDLVNHGRVARVMRGIGLVGPQLRRRHPIATAAADPSALPVLGPAWPRLHRRSAEHQVCRRHHVIADRRRHIPLPGQQPRPQRQPHGPRPEARFAIAAPGTAPAAPVPPRSRSAGPRPCPRRRRGTHPCSLPSWRGSSPGRRGAGTGSW